MTLREEIRHELERLERQRTLDEVADRLNLTRERVRQIEEAALAKLQAAGVNPEELRP